MKKIENQIIAEASALANLENIEVIASTFEETSKDSLVNSRHVKLKDTTIDTTGVLNNSCDVVLLDSILTEYADDCLLNSSNIEIVSSNLAGRRVLSRVKNLKVLDSNINCPETCQFGESIHVENTKLISESAFKGSTKLTFNRINFAGKYAFQNTKDVTIKDSVFKSQDAFWHSKNVTITDSLIEGERFGWYTEQMTLIRCHIKGSSPLCHAKKIKLIDCTMAETDNAFELSDVEAEIKGNIKSVKNPLSGNITADTFGDIILEYSKYPIKASINAREK